MFLLYTIYIVTISVTNLYALDILRSGIFQGSGSSVHLSNFILITESYAITFIFDFIYCYEHVVVVVSIYIFYLDNVLEIITQQI